MPFGYNGKILHVDLTQQKWHVEEPGEKWYRTYMGGSAFASYYLLKMLKTGIDPLSPENVLVFACSVVTGAPISGWNRYTVAAKSPLTHAFGESEAGGFFGPELKFAGFDAIVIQGRAATPTYLFIKDGEVQFRDAKEVWGLDNFETLLRIQAEVGDKRVRVASIGPAGERLIRFANVSNDVEHFNGRTGMGAVLGSKNLKAVAVRGTQRMESAEPEKVKEIARWHNARIKTHPPNVGLTSFGTPGLVKGLNATGILPTRNFREGVFEGADKLNADAYASILHSSGTCWTCAVKCKRRVALEDAKYPLNPKWGGPEYETIAAFGSMIGNDNLPAVGRGNQLCNLYGLDTVSMGNVTAFVMECFENGILTEKDTGGRKLTFGDPDAMLWLIEEVVHRRGIGDILAEGVKTAAERIGRGSEQFAFTIKGNDLPFHDGRGKTGMALGLCPVRHRGGPHRNAPRRRLSGRRRCQAACRGAAGPGRAPGNRHGQGPVLCPGPEGLGHQQPAEHLQLHVGGHPRHDLPQPGRGGAGRHRLGHQSLRNHAGRGTVDGHVPHVQPAGRLRPGGRQGDSPVARADAGRADQGQEAR